MGCGYVEEEGEWNGDVQRISEPGKDRVDFSPLIFRSNNLATSSVSDNLRPLDSQDSAEITRQKFTER